MEMKFEIKDAFYKDGEKIRIFSGAIHYFRVMPQYWEDSLKKLKACGFNTVETYIPWNVHEPREGEFYFEGMADVEKFLEISQKLGLMAIVRPGPYICAEWEFGALPWWLLNKEGIKIRCYNEVFLKYMDRYFEELIKRLKPHFATNGGNIIAMQVENEYGSYGNDKRYLAHIRDKFISLGVDIPLFTSDGAEDFMLQNGMLEGVFATANFGSNPEDRFAVLQKYQKDKPLMCMEFWGGWFDPWGGRHAYRDPQDAADHIDRLLKMGGNFNIYMFHGGTNFGFMNGANHYDRYEPTVSSYDSDAPLSEAGDITPKYRAIYEVMKKYSTVSEIPADREKRAYGKVEMKSKKDIFSALDEISSPIENVYPLPMEKCNQGYGYILYKTHVTGPLENVSLTIHGLADRAQVYLDKKLVGIVYRNGSTTLTISTPEGGAELDIIVENMGRTNYGPKMFETKGINNAVCINTASLFNWKMYPLPMDNLDKLNFDSSLESEVPTAFYKGNLVIEDEPCDTFLRTDDFTKGVAFVNGFNLGRFWEIGPTKTLYVPGVLLKKGDNEIIVFDSDGAKTKTPCVEFVAEPEL